MKINLQRIIKLAAGIPGTQGYGAFSPGPFVRIVENATGLQLHKGIETSLGPHDSPAQFGSGVSTYSSTYDPFGTLWAESRERDRDREVPHGFWQVGVSLREWDPDRASVTNVGLQENLDLDRNYLEVDVWAYYVISLQDSNGLPISENADLAGDLSPEELQDYLSTSWESPDKARDHFYSKILVPFARELSVYRLSVLQPLVIRLSRSPGPALYFHGVKGVRDGLGQIQPYPELVGSGAEDIRQVVFPAYASFFVPLDDPNTIYPEGND